MSQQELHVVLGAGQVGPILASKLTALGHRVRIVSRSGTPKLPEAVEWARGDITDATFLNAALQGAGVVYHCANPMRYDRWEELLPPIARAVQTATTRAGARLVVLDNLYMYGAPAGPISEASPIAPQSRKGHLRARLAEELSAAQARGELHVSVGRASDFIGPNAARAAMFGPAFFDSLARGRAAYALGDPDQPHAYAYIPDVAEGLLLLGTRPTALGQTWLLPHVWNDSSRKLAQRLAALSGREAKLWKVPSWLLHVGGLWNGELSAVPEMMYQWRAPFTVDDSRFRAAFGAKPSAVAQALTATLRAYGIEPQPTAAATAHAA
jgi:nucleoside-diphosphate-sugar epimerase